MHIVDSCTCRYILDDVDRHWSYHDKDKDGFISLKEYQDTSYGVIEGKLDLLGLG